MASPTGSGSGSKRPQRAVAQRLAPGAYTEQLVLSTEGNPYRIIGSPTSAKNLRRPHNDGTSSSQQRRSSSGSRLARTPNAGQAGILSGQAGSRGGAMAAAAAGAAAVAAAAGSAAASTEPVADQVQCTAASPLKPAKRARTEDSPALTAEPEPLVAAEAAEAAEAAAPEHLVTAEAEEPEPAPAPLVAAHAAKQQSSGYGGHSSEAGSPAPSSGEVALLPSGPEEDEEVEKVVEEEEQQQQPQQQEQQQQMDDAAAPAEAEMPDAAEPSSNQSGLHAELPPAGVMGESGTEQPPDGGAAGSAGQQQQAQPGSGGDSRQRSAGAGGSGGSSAGGARQQATVERAQRASPAARAGSPAAGVGGRRALSAEAKSALALQEEFEVTCLEPDTSSQGASIAALLRSNKYCGFRLHTAVSMLPPSDEEEKRTGRKPAHVVYRAGDHVCCLWERPYDPEREEAVATVLSFVELENGLVVPALRWTDLWEDVVARPTDDVLRYPADDALRGRNCVWQHSLDLQDPERLHFIFKPDMYAHLLGQHVKLMHQDEAVERYGSVDAYLRAEGPGAYYYHQQRVPGLLRMEDAPRPGHALQPKRLPAEGLTAMDGFCGSGSVSWGLESAGFQTRLGIDCGERPYASYVQNFPHAGGSYKCMTLNESLEHAKAETPGFPEAGSITLAHFSPPCQSLSTANAQRSVEQAAGELQDKIGQVWDWIAFMQPKMITLEEVPAFMFLRTRPKGGKGGKGGKGKAAAAAASAADEEEDQDADSDFFDDTGSAGDDDDAEGGGTSAAAGVAARKRKGAKGVQAGGSGSGGASGSGGGSAAFKVLRPWLLLVPRLLQLGYQVDIRFLQAAAYGAANMRMRCWLLAAAKGYELPQPPKPRYHCLWSNNRWMSLSHMPRDSRMNVSLGDEGAGKNWQALVVQTHDSLPWSIAVREAIGDLPRLPDPSRPDDPHVFGSETMSLDEAPEGGAGAAAQPLSRYAHWCRTAQMPRGGGQRLYRQVLFAHHRSRTRSVPAGACMQWDKPAGTVCTKDDPGRTAHLHPEQRRPLTVAEKARLMGMPHCMVLSGSTAEQYKQVGNAVPPPMAYEIGAACFRALTGQEPAYKLPLLAGYVGQPEPLSARELMEQEEERQRQRREEQRAQRAAAPAAAEAAEEEMEEAGEAGDASAGAMPAGPAITCEPAGAEPGAPYEQQQQQQQQREREQRRQRRQQQPGQASDEGAGLSSAGRKRSAQGADASPPAGKRGCHLQGTEGAAAPAAAAEVAAEPAVKQEEGAEQQPGSQALQRGSSGEVIDLLSDSEEDEEEPAAAADAGQPEAANSEDASQPGEPEAAGSEGGSQPGDAAPQDSGNAGDAAPEASSNAGGSEAGEMPDAADSEGGSQPGEPTAPAPAPEHAPPAKQQQQQQQQAANPQQAVKEEGGAAAPGQQQDVWEEWEDTAVVDLVSSSSDDDDDEEEEAGQPSQQQQQLTDAGTNEASPSASPAGGAPALQTQAADARAASTTPASAAAAAAAAGFDGHYEFPDDDTSPEERRLGGHELLMPSAAAQAAARQRALQAAGRRLHL